MQSTNAAGSTWCFWALMVYYSQQSWKYWRWWYFGELWTGNNAPTSSSFHMAFTLKVRSRASFAWFLSCANAEKQTYIKVLHIHGKTNQTKIFYDSHLPPKPIKLLIFHMFFITGDVQLALQAAWPIPRSLKVNGRINLQWPWEDSN